MLVKNQNVDIRHIGDNQCECLSLTAGKGADLNVEAVFKTHITFFKQ